MQQSETQIQRINFLDSRLRESEGGLSSAALTEDEESFRGWYARMLSTLAVASDGEEVVYAQGSVIRTTNKAQSIVITDSYFIVVNVDDVTNDGASAVASLLPRSSLKTLGISTSQRFDVRGSQSYGWPGVISLTVAYEGLDESVVIEGLSYDRYSSDHVGAIWTVMNILKADLKGAA